MYSHNCFGPAFCQFSLSFLLNLCCGLPCDPYSGLLLWCIRHPPPSVIFPSYQPDLVKVVPSFISSGFIFVKQTPNLFDHQYSEVFLFTLDWITVCLVSTRSRNPAACLPRAANTWHFLAKLATGCWQLTAMSIHIQIVTLDLPALLCLFALSL